MIQAECSDLGVQTSVDGDSTSPIALRHRLMTLLHDTALQHDAYDAFAGMRRRNVSSRFLAVVLLDSAASAVS